VRNVYVIKVSGKLKGASRPTAFEPADYIRAFRDGIVELDFNAGVGEHIGEGECHPALAARRTGQLHQAPQVVRYPTAIDFVEDCS
jgi:hypothetical protein